MIFISREIVKYFKARVQLLGVESQKKTALQEVQSTFSMEPNSPKSFEALMNKTTQRHSLVALQGAEIYLTFIPSNHS